MNFEKGALLKAFPNSSENYQVVRIHDVTNFQMIGTVEIIGERDQHLGTTGEWGMGISIRGSNNVLIENVAINNMWGDGIYIGSTELQNFSENIKIINPILNNNRRQGISIISAKKLEINSAVITNTKGTPPQCGIDIEPNNSKESLENIRIINLTTNNNASLGVKIYLKNIMNNISPIDIYFDSLKNVADGFGIRESNGVRGEIKVGEHYYLTEKEVNKEPIVDEIYDFSTNIKGTVQVNSLISVKVNNVEIGSAKSNPVGRFDVKIPKQKVNSKLSITAVDINGKTSDVVNKIVKGKMYSDLNLNHWAYKEIEYIVGRNIINGYPNGSFQPEKKTTRAEAAKMLALALDLPIKNTSSNYKDVSSKHWAKDYITAVSKAGLFNGNPDGTFAPNDVLKRAEMAKVISIAYELDASNKNHFNDVKTGHWAKGYISGLYENSITTGFPDKTFRPEASTTRAEYSVFLARALNKEFR